MLPAPGANDTIKEKRRVRRTVWSKRMRLLPTITARALIWLAALMTSWQGLVGMACAVGGPRSTIISHPSPAIQNARDAGGQCRLATCEASAGSSCCKRSTATARADSVSRFLRCGCDRSCTCCGPCLCRQDRPTPPLPAPAGPQAGKVLSTPSGWLVAPAIDLPGGTTAGRGLWHFSPSVPTSLERLSTLCRFLI